jgi:hypothetical protein
MAARISSILSHTQRNRVLLQDFRPLRESLEWQLGQHYYLESGNKGFIADSAPIPFMINNDGNLSAKAADLLFAAVDSSFRQGALEE